MRFRTIEVRRDPACPVCGTRTQTTLIDYHAFCGVGPAPAAQALDDVDVDPRALAQRIASGVAPMLVDIREPWETAIARLPGAELVPMSSIVAGTAEVPRDREVILYCRSGARSGRLMEALRAQGYDRLRHLRGGIEAWRVDVDPSVPRY
jgi:adenylyltransferase/sulfurtransferase